MSTGGKPIDLRGQRFGRLVALFRTRHRERTFWRCWCDCGRQHDVPTAQLRRGDIVSCGCARAEMRANARTARGFVSVVGT